MVEPTNTVDTGASAPLDTAVLSGQPVAQPAAVAGASPVSTLGGTPDQPSAFAASDVAPDAVVSTPATSNLGGTQAAPAPPPVAGQPSVWKNIALGALAGAASGAGTKSFGQGAARGQEQEQQILQQQKDNAVRQQQIQFESVKAADSHIAALNARRSADNENTEAQQRISANADAAEELLEEHGFTPAVTVSGGTSAEAHAQASGALRTLANANGGAIPQVATTNSPDGKVGSTNVYTTTQQNVTQNPNGVLDIINKARAVKGQPAINNQADLQIAGGQIVKGNWRAGVAQMSNDALGFFTQIPALSKGKSPNEISSENAATSAHLQQQLDTYQQSSNADPKVVQTLKTQMEAFNKTAENQRAKASTGESNTTLEQAPSKAESARQEDLAKQDTPQGRATLQKTVQDTIDAKYKNADAHQKSLFETGMDPQTGEKLNLSNAPDESLIDGNTKQPIPTKMLSTLKPTQQESNRADFSRSALHILDVLEAQKAAGKLPNGPISGFLAKNAAKIGLGDADSQKALNEISLGTSAATGAHVGGRFSSEIMGKMNQTLNLNMNDSQFDGAIQSLRTVLSPYAQQGGRETVGQYKQQVIGSVQTLKNGQKVKVTGLDKSGNFTGNPVNN